MMARQAKPAMGRAEVVDADVEKGAELLHGLDLAHQKLAGEADLLVADEEARRLRVRILLLRGENSTLRQEIDQSTEAKAELEAQNDDLDAHLEAKLEVIRHQEQQLRKHEREFTQLKAELQSMQSVSEDSTNLLGEKLSLTRELSLLKPELEHLRSQLTHQQSTLAEKLSLERQVTTLEVELANEKKATKRVMQSRESTGRAEDELRQKLREVEKQLAAEKSQRERLEDQLAQQKQSHDFTRESQESTREAESGLRKKLQETQRQLREATADRERIEGELEAQKQVTSKKSSKQSSAEADGEVYAKLELAEERLAAERKAKDKLRSETTAALEEAESRYDAQVKKVEKLKAKLRETIDELKHCRADLAKAQQPQQDTEVDDSTTKVATGRQVFRKRKPNEMGAEDFASITIATPGAEGQPRQAARKKQPLKPTAVGEKSEFSITPFLDRSKSMSDDIVPEDDEEMDDTFMGQNETKKAAKASNRSRGSMVSPVYSGSFAHEDPSATPPPEEDDQPKAKRGRPKKVLSEAPSAKKNAQPALKTALKKPTRRLGMTVDKSAKFGRAGSQQEGERAQTVKFNIEEQPQDESAAPAEASAEADLSNGEEPPQVDEPPADEPKFDEPKKKKRKILGAKKTLFDEDDDEGEAPAPKAASATSIGGQKRIKAPLGGGVRNAFGGASFSPLKRHKRGVNASFLQ